MRERRKVSRYPVGVAGSLHRAGERVVATVTVRMISPIGCELDRAPSLGAGKKCELYFDWQGVQMGLQAQVVWTDAQARMGLKFRSVDKDTQKRLDELCASLRSRPSSSPFPGEPARCVASPAAASPPTSHPAHERERRRVPRYVSDLPACLSSLATGATSGVALVTLSILGGCLEGAGLPAVGQKCELNTEWEGKPLVIQGEVVWKSKDRVGVRFAALEAEAERLLRAVCANLRLQPLAPLPGEPE